MAIAASFLVAMSGPAGGSTAVAARPPSEWAQFRADAGHSGHNPVESVLNASNVNDLILLWSKPYEEPSTMQVVNGVVYVGSADGNLYALDADTGAESWRYHGGNARSGPMISAGIVYQVWQAGQAAALDAASGAVLWQTRTSYFGFTERAFWDGRVFVGHGDSDGKRIAAIDGATGRVQWDALTSHATGHQVSPATSNDMVFGGRSGSQPTSLSGLDADTGSRVWKAKLGYMTLSDPVAVGGLVYAGLGFSGEGGLVALDAFSGGLVWRVDLGWVPDPVAVASGVVFACAQNRLHALDGATGGLLWTTGDTCSVAPVVANGVVYAGSGFTVRALDVVSGDILTTLGRAYEPEVTVADGKLFLSSPTDGVFVYGLP